MTDTNNDTFVFPDEIDFHNDDNFDTISETSEILQKLSLNHKNAEARIEKHFNYLANYLNHRKNHLLNKLNKIYEQKCLNLKEKKIENEFIGFNTEIDDDNDNDDDADDDNLGRSLLKQIMRMVSKYGQIISTDAIETNCTLSGEGLMQCFINEEATFTLSCRDINNNLTKTHSSFISSFITPSESTVTQEMVMTKKFKLATGLFLVKYSLEKEGIFLLNILLNGKHIANSPYKIT